MNDNLSPSTYARKVLLRSSQARLKEGAKLFAEADVPPDSQMVVLTLISTALEAVQCCVEAD